MTTLRSVALRGAAAVLLLAASGCADDLAAPASPEAHLTTAAGSQQQGVQTITYAIARSLEDPRLRQRLLEDLRDSPNPQHKLHLKSYLQGADGGALLAAGARRLKKPQHELLALLQSMPEMELVVPRRFDRITWTGSADLAVFGLGRSLEETGREGGRLSGYTPAGDSVSISVFDDPPYVMLMLRPQEGSFGPDPEVRRAAVPNRGRNTISKREVEFSLDPNVSDPECTGPGCSNRISPGDVTIACLDDPSTPEIECSPAGPQPVPAGGADLGFSFTYCTSPAGDDADQDGVRDGCEEVIAQNFAPVLRIDERDRCPTREPYWSVARRPESPRSLKIMYLLSYHLDCPNPALIWGNTGHRGDSEWIVISVVTASNAPTRWYTYSITTSAHFGETSDATKTTTYDNWPEWSQYTYRVAPVVWVALDKHANYRSRGDCEDGAYWWDSCGHPWRDEVVDVKSHAEANVGNQWTGPTAGQWDMNDVRLKDMVQSRHPAVFGYQSERIWGSPYQWAPEYFAEPFCGWQSGTTKCASGYAKPVYAYGF